MSEPKYKFTAIIAVSLFITIAYTILHYFRIPYSGTWLQQHPEFYQLTFWEALLVGGDTFTHHVRYYYPWVGFVLAPVVFLGQAMKMNKEIK